MIDDECKRFRPTKDYLAHLPPPNYAPYETELTRSELTRVAAGRQMEPLDLRRYSLPGPSSGRMTDPLAWKQAVDNSKAQLEAQRIRGVNLDAMIECGPEMWRRQCKVLEHQMTVRSNRIQEMYSFVCCSR